MWLKLWTDCANESDKDLQAKVALRIARMCRLHLPRKADDREDFDGNPSAYDALTGGFPNLYAPRTLDEVLTVVLNSYPRRIPHYVRWINHLENRIAYEKAMLAEAGGTVTDKIGPQKGGACQCWASHRGGWSYIQKVNQVSVSILRNYSDGGRPFSQTIPFDELTGMMTAAEV